MGGFTSFAKDLADTLCKNSPKILMGLGIAGMVTATVLAVKATPKACEKLKEEEVDTKDTVEVVKKTWKYYIPSASVSVLSIGCLICSNAASERQKAALAAAATMTQKALEEYEEKVIKAIGPKKNQAIRDEVSKDKLDENYPIGLIQTGKGTTLCMDSYSGQVFESSADAIHRAVNNVNRRMRDEIYISLNEFYSELGIERMMFGDEIGWNIDRGYVDISFSSIVTQDERPCLVINYTLIPDYNFDD